ncbi:MAG: DNA-methyltransferase [Alphaproteobacteria bacterium]
MRSPGIVGSLADGPAPPLAVDGIVLRGRIADSLRQAETKLWNLVRQIGEGTAVEPCIGIALVPADALAWMTRLPDDCLHGIVTDPPYGLIEYQGKDHTKLRQGRGGVWRIPPAFDGVERSPLPRFTVLSEQDRKQLDDFFFRFAMLALRKLAPGGHLMIASTPLLSTTTFACFEKAGFEKRGEIIRLVQTLRGGDRPKGAEREFADVSVMPRAGWEPWGLFRKPISERTVAANLRRWGTGGLRRISGDEPFRDVIDSAPTRAIEREIAPHPSLKPQRFMRQLIRAVLPLGIGVVYDPFAGAGSTLAAAARVGYRAVGTELDPEYAAMACRAIPLLRDLYPGGDGAGLPAS